MSKYTHNFVEEYNGHVGFGFDREVDEATLTCYLQMFADDRLMALIRNRMSEADMEVLFDMISRLLKQYLTEPEYHEYFLRDMDD
jgi:hypothetical protein